MHGFFDYPMMRCPKYLFIQRLDSSRKLPLIIYDLCYHKNRFMFSNFRTSCKRSFILTEKYMSKFQPDYPIHRWVNLYCN